ncbi:hypothetical protein V3W47_19015 [Deinococcus sp. YIM 134068]|uniref:hypothetical protein n=1 Tax=Deinococcus lichenicola TaxID=3118910 RepID=UPI002F923251
MDAKTVIGVLVGTAGVVGAALVMLSGSQRTTTPTGAASGAAPPAGVALAVDGGTVVNVGMVSTIPTAKGYDTGAVDYTYNRDGWDTVLIGVKA